MLIDAEQMPPGDDDFTIPQAIPHLLRVLSLAGKEIDAEVWRGVVPDARAVAASELLPSLVAGFAREGFLTRMHPCHPDLPRQWHEAALPWLPVMCPAVVQGVPHWNPPWNQLEQRCTLFQSRP